MIAVAPRVSLTSRQRKTATATDLADHCPSLQNCLVAAVATEYFARAKSRTLSFDATARNSARRHPDSASIRTAATRAFSDRPNAPPCPLNPPPSFDDDFWRRSVQDCAHHPSIFAHHSCPEPVLSAQVERPPCPGNREHLRAQRFQTLLNPFALSITEYAPVSDIDRFRRLKRKPGSASAGWFRARQRPTPLQRAAAGRLSAMRARCSCRAANCAGLP